VEPPPDAEGALTDHAQRVRSGRPTLDPAVRTRLAEALAGLQAVQIGRDQIALESDAPGGVVAKKVVGRVVRPQIDGVFAQLHEQKAAIERLAAVLVEVVDALSRDLDGVVVQQLDDLQVRMAEQRKALNALRSSQS
jgi:hypothetical protein